MLPEIPLGNIIELPGNGFEVAVQVKRPCADLIAADIEHAIRCYIVLRFRIYQHTGDIAGIGFVLIFDNKRFRI